MEDNEEFRVLRAIIGARMQAGQSAHGIARELWNGNYRADLVDRLKGYEIKHKPECKVIIYHFDNEPNQEIGCTCGLTEVLKEME